MVKGVALSVFASCLFGLVYYYPVFLRPLSIVDIFCWRLLMSFPAILALVLVEKQWHSIIDLVVRIKKNPLFLLGLLFSASILSVQMLIFVWAPLTGRALSASLGYFMLPLTMVVCGRIFYKERFSFLQKIAVTLACAGVAIEIYVTGAFSWETAVICLGYPIYFMFRRKMKIDGISGTFSDFFFLALACGTYFAIQYDFNKIIDDVNTFHLYLPMLGIITAIAFAAYFASGKLLPLGLFGLLGYVEPVLLAIVSIVFLHESLSPEHILPYSLIWSAVLVLIIEGVVYTMRSLKRKRH